MPAKGVLEHVMAMGSEGWKATVTSVCGDGAGIVTLNLTRPLRRDTNFTGKSAGLWGLSRPVDTQR